MGKITSTFLLRFRIEPYLNPSWWQTVIKSVHHHIERFRKAFYNLHWKKKEQSMVKLAVSAKGFHCKILTVTLNNFIFLVLHKNIFYLSRGLCNSKVKCLYLECKSKNVSCSFTGASEEWRAVSLTFSCFLCKLRRVSPCILKILNAVASFPQFCVAQQSISDEKEELECFFSSLWWYTDNCLSKERSP